MTILRMRYYWNLARLHAEQQRRHEEEADNDRKVAETIRRMGQSGAADPANRAETWDRWAERDARRAEHHRLLKQKYEYAASHPTEELDPDPPLPE